MRALPALLLMLLLAAPAPARAQALATQDPQAAEASFQEASALFEGGTYERACPLFLQSYRLDTTKPGALHALAECYARWGKIASASARYGEYIEAVKLLPPDRQANHADRVRGARAEMLALSQQVPELTLVLPGSAPQSTRVTLDGDEVASASLGRPRPVDPGDHRVATQVPGQRAAEQTISIGKGEKKQLVLEVRGPIPDSPGPTIDPSQSPSRNGAAAVNEVGGMSGQRLVAYAGLGIGGAALVVGVVTGVLVFAKKASIQDECTARLPSGQKGCKTQDALDAAEGVQTLGAVSTAGFVAASVGGAAGLILLLTEPKKEHAAAHRWIAIGVGSSDSGGAVVQARGAF